MLTWDYLPARVPSLIPSLGMPPGEKQSGGQSQIFGAYSQKVVRTNEIVRSLITSLTAVKCFISTRVFVSFWTGFGKKCSITRAYTSPRNLTWFARLFFLMRKWGLGTRLQDLLMYYSVPQHTESLAGVWTSSLIALHPGLHPMQLSSRAVLTWGKAWSVHWMHGALHSFSPCMQPCSKLKPQVTAQCQHLYRWKITWHGICGDFSWVHF